MHNNTKRKAEQLNQPNKMITIPTASEYEKALTEIEGSITDKQKIMLEAHFNAHNRSITFADLATVAEYPNYSSANLQYGKLGKNLGDALGFEFEVYGNDKTKFTSSAIALEDPYSDGILMHHELAKALINLSWF